MSDDDGEKQLDRMLEAAKAEQARVFMVKQAWCAAYDDHQVQTSHVWLEEHEDEVRVTVTTAKPVRLNVNGEQFAWKEGQTLLGG